MTSTSKTEECSIKGEIDMLLPAKCPECGELIEVDSNKAAANCKFCSNAFVVKEAVELFNTYFNIPTNNTSTQDTSKDFVIVAGILKEYRGVSADVVIPDGVVGIGESCFAGIKITSIVIPDSVKSIEKYAFSNCTVLESVYINDLANWCNITFDWVGSNPLEYAKKLYINGELTTDLIFPNTIISISKYAFCNCHCLNSITIPESIEDIVGVFNSSDIISVTLPQNIKEFSFGGCKNLSSITLPSNLKVLPRSAFYDCIGLTSITLPDGLTRIEDSAFYGCTGLTSITIPKSVVSVGYEAFKGCTNLETVKIHNSQAYIANEAFEGTPYARRKEREKAAKEHQALIDSRKRKGQCQHCGGQLIGMITKKCTRCGKPKDY